MRHRKETPRRSRPLDLLGLEHPANEIGRRLDIAVILEAVELGPPIVIRAVLMRGGMSQSVVAEGATQSEALRELAELAAEWAQKNPISKPYWPAGG